MLIFRFLLLGTVSASSLCAEVAVPALFSDHAVLQRSSHTRVWGSALPGEKVRVEVASVASEVIANEQGSWEVLLDLSQCSAGPFTLEVVGENRLTVKDVLIGDVWLASGQSNMGWTLQQSAGAADEVAQSLNPELRWFTVSQRTSARPLERVEGKWEVAGPATSGRASAVAYYFGKNLQQTLKRPIGLVNASWGGTPVEAWSSMRGLSADPELKEDSERAVERLSSYPTLRDEYVEALRLWEQKYERSDRPADGMPAEGWELIEKPLAWYAGGGAVWLRTVVKVPPQRAGKAAAVMLRNVIGNEQVFWNGERIGAATPAQAAESIRRTYMVPADKVAAGESTLVIRLFGSGAFRLLHTGTILFMNAPLPKESVWEQVEEFSLPVLQGEAKATLPPSPGLLPQEQATSGFLFNAMIHPLLRMSMTGAIWYQGEGNTGRAFQYQRAFPLMISDWREQWGLGDFPFYFCQLANYQPKAAEPGESIWAELREAQQRTLSLPNTGQAVLIDVGEEGDIHPRDKKTPGERLAALALTKHYGKPGVSSGPSLQEVRFTGGKAVLTFANADGGLVARPLPRTYQPLSTSPQEVLLKLALPDSQLHGFAICGEDQRWKWANAVIEGDKVILSSPEVANPVAVRYAWSDNPTVNFYNGAGFPAAPFRTDDFPWTTQNVRY